MLEAYTLDPGRNIPIYQQIVDVILAEIKSGRLKAGERLPVVRELSKQLSTASGTVKRAYDELERMQVIEKIQGKGTFVRREPTKSRKERSLAAIDALLDELTQMEFSLAEIKIYLDLKLRERTARMEALKIAIVDCNPEVLAQLSDQLRQMVGVELYSYLISDVIAYPYRISEEMDLIVISAEHMEELKYLLPHQERVVRVALRLHAETVTKILRIPAGSRVGILTRSERFGQVLCRVCEEYTERCRVLLPALFQSKTNYAEFVKDKDVVLVPANFEQYEDADRLAQLGDCKLIRCSYRIDEGSCLYLEEKVERLKERRRV